VAEPDDAFLDPRAPGLLLVEQRISALHQPALGNVVVDADPVIRTGEWPIDDGNRAPVGYVIDEAHRLAGGDILRIAPQAAAVDPVANHVDQRRFGLHDLR